MKVNWETEGHRSGLLIGDNEIAHISHPERYEDTDYYTYDMRVGGCVHFGNKLMSDNLEDAKKELINIVITEYGKQIGVWKKCIAGYEGVIDALKSEPEQKDASVQSSEETLLSKIDADCKEQYERFLGTSLTKQQYSDIDGHVGLMILEYETAEEFFKDYIWLYGYAEWSTDLKDADSDNNSMEFLVSKEWLLKEFFNQSEAELTEFLSEYTAEESIDIYSQAVLTDNVVFEKLS